MWKLLFREKVEIHDWLICLENLVKEILFIFSWFISCKVCTSCTVISILPNSDLYFDCWIPHSYKTTTNQKTLLKYLNNPSSPKVFLQYARASVFQWFCNLSIYKSCLQLLGLNCISGLDLLSVSVAGTLLGLVITPCLQFKSIIKFARTNPDLKSYFDCLRV